MELKREDCSRKISFILGKFHDSRIEAAYNEDEMKKSVKQIKPLVASLGILYFLFIIPDFFVIKDLNTFEIILINRTVFLSLTLMLYHQMNHFKNYNHYSIWIMAYEIIASFFFLITFYYYESVNFFIQTFGVVIIILAVFLVPNRLIYMAAVSTSITIGFFLAASYLISDIKVNELISSYVYLFLVIAFNTFATMRINYSKRIQYLYQQELEKSTTIDTLTGAYNRIVFNHELEKWIHDVHKYHVELAVVMFDIDDFKRVNDNFGHSMGDMVLSQISELVQKVIRNYDVFARWGGEEFILLVPNVSLNQAVEIADRLKEIIFNAEFKAVGRISCSFGVTLLNKDDNISSLIDRVDQFLYRAKERGKNQVISDLSA